MRHEKARFDGHLSLEQKQLFEKATQLGGFRTLTEFVFSSAKEKAQEIIKKHEAFLSSEKDRKVFFNTLLNPVAPNKKLLSAAKNYQKELNQ